ncbi:MAG: NAD(P)/FAD-dependent oxidoreductase [Candidatus Omnitrophica bacterium]|nr:NAD(P)/FAD-dependent oxidoreductase [Candidatus Omnitrophota bacterium]
MKSSQVYDIAVLGAGPAGSLAAIRAGAFNKKVILIERNNSIGRKMLLTGKGRCNLTNTASLEAFVEKFGKQGNFLRSAFFAFSNCDLMQFLESNGLRLKIERQGRVFPVTDSSCSVIDVLRKCLDDNKVELLFNKRLLSVKRESDFFRLELDDKASILSKKLILATGGVSYKKTGSSGDGLLIARKLGHSVIALSPALVPLKAGEEWIKELQGVSLKNVSIAFGYGKKKIKSPVGEVMFTHFGISGPLVLDLSQTIVGILKEHKELSLFIDLKPGLTDKQLENRLLRDFSAKGNTKLKKIMIGYLPRRLSAVLIELSGISPEITASQVTREERQSIKNLLKAFALTIIRALPIEEAMVTAGGIFAKEINPRTMESKIIRGLYFAGEIIEGAAASGGYNLQQAFSTGYLAGEKAALCVE